MLFTEECNCSVLLGYNPEFKIYGHLGLNQKTEYVAYDFSWFPSGHTDKFWGSNLKQVMTASFHWAVLFVS
jgi:hypothetical protein